MTATIDPKEIAVEYNLRAEVGREFLTITHLDGWGEIKKFTKKVLTFEGRKFTWCSWNSDINSCTFYRMLDGSGPKVAKIS